MQARLLGTVLLALNAAGVLAAQEVTGRIEGRVRTADGAGLPDVRITVSSSSLIGTRTALTDPHGRFQISALPVGVYRVALRRIAFRPLDIERVLVRLGETAPLPQITLEGGAAELAPLVINADPLRLDPLNTAARLTLDSRKLDALPLERNFRGIVLLAPGATPSFYVGFDRDGVNVAGATGYENSYFVDGINITSPTRGETSIDLPYNFIEQIQVRTGGSTAEDAQALGGVVSVVTPNGGNEFRTRIFTFFSNDALQTNPRTLIGAAQSGFLLYDVGGSLSGPLRRDQLWYFAAYNANYERREYRYRFGTLAEERRQHLFAGKLTWRPAESASLTFTVLGDPSRSDRLAFPPLVALPGVPQNREVLQQDHTVHSTGLSLRALYFLTPRLLVETSVAQMTRLEDYVPPTAAAPSPVVTDAVTGTVYGGFGDRERYDGRRRTATLDVSLSLLSHSLKAGAQYEALRNTMLFDLSRTGAGGTITRVDIDRWIWHSSLITDGRGTNYNPSLYVQDLWQATSRLLLSAGIRWSRQDIVDGVADTLHFRVQDGFQPRIGVSYQLGRLGSQRLFVSYGRVAQQIPTWFAQQYGTGAESLLVFRRDPRVDPTPDEVEYGFDYSVPAAARRLRGQTSDEWSVGYERRIARSLVLTGRALRRSLRDAVQTGTHVGGLGFYWGNPGRAGLRRFPLPRREYDALDLSLERAAQAGPTVRVSYVLSRTRGNYPGQYSPDWRIGVPNYGPLFFSPAQFTNASGLLPNDRTHVLKVVGSHDLGRGLDLGISFLFASGTPLSEYGAIPGFGVPFRGFVRPRGSAGRTPAIWDLGLRTAYAVPHVGAGHSRARVTLDVLHVGSPRKAVDVDQFHYTCLDASGNQSCPRAAYRQVLQYQPPMTARLGVDIRP